MSKQEGAGRKSWGVYVARLVVVLILGFVLFMLSTPLISFYNQSHYSVKECTVTEADAWESRTVTTSAHLSIYTSDCGTLVYEVGATSDELERLAERVNEFRGQRLGFGFGDVQLQSNLSTVYSVEGLD